MAVPPCAHRGFELFLVSPVLDHGVGVVAEVLVGRLVRRTAVEVRLLHAAFPSSRAADLERTGHAHDLVSQVDKRTHAVKKGHLDDADVTGTRLCHLMQLGDERLTYVGKLDVLETGDATRGREGDHGEPLPVESARPRIDEVIAEGVTDLFEAGATGLEDGAGENVEVNPAGSERLHGSSDCRLSGGYATRKIDDVQSTP